MSISESVNNFVNNVKKASTDPLMKKIGDQMRLYPERRILNAFTVKDISTIFKDEFALVLVAYSLMPETFYKAIC